VFSNNQQDFDILEEIDFTTTETPFDDNINFDDINFDELLENELDNNNPQYKKLEFISKYEQKLTKDILIQLYNKKQNNVNYDSSDSTNNNYQSALDNKLAINSLLKQLKAKKNI
ncbi:12164_t:CDS:2, partial [Cetraspora pellucida]